MKHRYSGIWCSLHFSTMFVMLTIWSLVPLPSLNPACLMEISSSSLTFILLIMTRSMILLTCEMRLIVREFEHSFGFPFLGSGRDAALHQSFGHPSSHQMFVHNCQSNLAPSSPDAFQNSAGMSSAPGDFPFHICCKACSTSDLRGGG